MASRVAKGPPPPASAKTGVAVPADEKKVDVKPINRREFLFYCWGASMVMLLGQTSGILIWFMLPRFREGEFGGVFRLTSIPNPGDEPANYPSGKFWLSNTEDGRLVALYKVCTHLGCLYAWTPANDRFECPCHGSKYERDGTWIEGPAPRSLDRFNMTVVLANGEQLLTNVEGDPIRGVNPADVREVIIDTGARIKRAGRV
jgi:cytochrome b6-f complex iron-sulfur subunit